MSASISSSPASAGGVTTSIRDVRVVIGRDREVIPRATVTLHGDRIASISSATETTSMERTIDGAGLTLLPGLIDSHVHLAGFHRTRTDPTQRDIARDTLDIAERLPGILTLSLIHI